MRYLLGVDAGNTKTIALVAGLNGTIRGYGRSGCGDIYGAVTEIAALRAVEEAVEKALRAAKTDRSELIAAAFSLAGADWPEDYAFLSSEMESRGLGRKLVIVNDALGALRAGSQGGIGVSVVCGTGTAVGARGPDGRIWHTSFWQEECGSYDLGNLALRAMSRAELGISPGTSITKRALKLYNLRTVEDVLHAFTARGSDPERLNIGKLARILLEEADRGDPAASRIIREQGQMLGDYALAAARRVGIEDSPYTLVLAGGILRHSYRKLVESIIAQVRTVSPEVTPARAAFEPAVGALFLAYDLVGVIVDDLVKTRIIESAPPDALFSTS